MIQLNLNEGNCHWKPQQHIYACHWRQFNQSIAFVNSWIHPFVFIPHATKLGGVYWIHPVCLSVRLSVCPLTFRVCPVASTVQDIFFPHLVQMITSMRCAACDDLWPWPISPRSFDLDLENRVRSVASTVLHGFFSYLAQMITIIGGCVACYVFFRIWKLEILAIF